MKLNLGCGRCVVEGYVNLDKRDLKGVDVKVDVLNGLPFEDNYFDEVRAHHILEHLCPHEVYTAMEEILRVLKPNGLLDIRVPHASGIPAFANIDHKSFYTNASFLHFLPNHPENYYCAARFKLLKRELVWSIIDKTAWLNPLMNKIVNLCFFEHYFSNLIPVDELNVKLLALK